mmetsp:Transcript_28730/g.56106  ORF Transcript_28730/g.56106 Transcript_28730/m.56106 type:complete len:118 (-) Transcript_28730:225-578(-)
MEAGGGALSGVRGAGFTTIETVGWGFFTVLGLGMLVWMCRGTFLVSIVRDSFNKEKKALYARYRELAATKEHLHHHIAWSKQDGDHGTVASMEAQLKDAEDECKRIAMVLGRKIRSE